MRVLVCGGRDFDDLLKFHWEMRRIHYNVGITTIIHGGATGADTMAHYWGGFNDIRVIQFKAEWSRGKKAGPERNQRMLDEGKPDLVVAFPGGRGTADMVERARKANIEIMEISYGKETSRVQSSTE